MKKYCFIYKTTCLVTGLIYIGRHITTDLDDGYIGCGVYRQSDVDSPCSYFQNAVRKYKYENFKREILEFCKKEQLDDREQFWIRYLDSTNISIGFNMTKGGVGFCGHHSEESKNKMREKRRGTRSGCKNSFYGRRHSEKSLEKMRLSQRGKHVGELNSNFGKKASKETKEKISIKRLNCRRVICPYCMKKGDIANMTRWHFDNCKFKK